MVTFHITVNVSQCREYEVEATNSFDAHEMAIALAKKDCPDADSAKVGEWWITK